MRRVRIATWTSGEPVSASCVRKSLMRSDLVMASATEASSGPSACRAVQIDGFGAGKRLPNRGTLSHGLGMGNAGEDDPRTEHAVPRLADPKKRAVSAMHRDLTVGLTAGREGERGP